MRHLIDPMDLSVEEINHLLDLADDIIPVSYTHLDVYKRQSRNKERYRA